MARFLSRWGRAASQLATDARVGGASPVARRFHRSCSTAITPTGGPGGAAPTAAIPTSSSPPNRLFDEQEVRLNSLFWSRPCSLSLPPNSPLRAEEPSFEGIKHIILKLLLFYSKQSESIRGANRVYRRITSQVDKSAIYDVFHLEKTFKTTFSLLVLHMWLVLHRLKEEGKDGTEFGQYLYEIYNHDLELRVFKAGVNLLLTKWMKDLEKIFYGNLIAYDAAMVPDAKLDDLATSIWRNVFSEDGSRTSNDAAATAAVQAMARYARRESTCLLLTDKEAIFAGNFMFTSLENLNTTQSR
ncbi:CBP3-like protein [Curcuma longa]|uniref:CBP3-like protein n=1 Tax=Curcuma longa TaxID=136217 RepID=UPI003D9EB566